MATTVDFAYQITGLDKNSGNPSAFLEPISHLVEISQSSPLFHTYNEIEKAEFHSWISFINQSPLDLSKLNGFLASKSYLVGQSLTIADILVFAALHVVDGGKGVEVAVSLSFSHLSRWFDHIQHRIVAGNASSGLQIRTIPGINRAFQIPFLVEIASTPATTTTTATTDAPAAAPAAPAEEKKKGEEGGKKEKGGGKADKPAAAAGEKKDSKKAATESKPEATTPPPAPAAAAAAEASAPASADGLDPSKLEMKVGLIVKCWNHPESDKLLCEEIDLGEGNTRTIASGLRAFYTAEEMQGKKVLVLANLKERPMAGFKSQGMVLCASNHDHTSVKLLEVPETAVVGDRVDIAGFVGEPAPPAQVAKKKIFESLVPFVSHLHTPSSLFLILSFPLLVPPFLSFSKLRTDNHGIPSWNKIPFTIKGNQFPANSLVDSQIS